MANDTLDIGEVVKLSGIPTSTLRFYEEKGLIKSVGRHGLRRLFNSTIVERLSLITLAIRAGFSLDDIGKMFAIDGRLQINRQQLAKKADELDKKIRELTAMRDGLRHAANCPAPNHMECPTFQRLLHISNKDKQKRSRKKRKFDEK